MDKRELYALFNREIWDHFLDSEYALGRKRVTYEAWLTRSKVARRAMASWLSSVKACGVNPYFWVKHYPEPVPTDYNGSKSLPDEPMVIAVYNGKAGIYTKQDAEDYEMEIKQPFKL